MDAVTSPCGQCSGGNLCGPGQIRGEWFVRDLMLPAVMGAVVEGHQHYMDHTTLLTTGALRVEAHDKLGRVTIQTYHATPANPAWIHIPKDSWHRFTTLEPETKAFCVFHHEPGSDLGRYGALLMKRI